MLHRRRRANADTLVQHPAAVLVPRLSHTTLVVTPAAGPAHSIRPNVVVETTVQYVAAGVLHTLTGSVVMIPVVTGATHVLHPLGASTVADAVGAGTAQLPATVAVGAGVLPTAQRSGLKLFIGYHRRRPSRTFPYPCPSFETVRTGRERTKMGMGMGSHPIVST
ncbi:hypothetical protein OH76DRAFT_755395 [Lentinus brumalis]|uniref:Uncharacterized protein n=1 Tax=Lentinus brumalis TaxID=2498619 RepID=A0A371DSU0_9APHY|nr:hypothetical protein OH76DRAFT_755395 [Polyporus brumalis]